MDIQRRRHVISSYGAVLQHRHSSVGRESDLPYPREMIRRALAQDLLEEVDEERRNALACGLVELESFVSDNEADLVQAWEKALSDGKGILEIGRASCRERVYVLV